MFPLFLLSFSFLSLLIFLVVHFCSLFHVLQQSLENEFADDVANRPRIQFSGGGSSTLSMTMNKEKAWNKVELSCWEGCNVESESNVKGGPEY